MARRLCSPLRPPTRRHLSLLRVAEEASRRSERELEERKEQLRLEELKRLALAAGKNPSDIDQETLRNANVEQLEHELREKQRKQREDELKRKVEQAKRLDVLVRALRETERAKVEPFQQAMNAETAAYVHDYNAATLDKAEQKHKEAMAVQKDLKRMEAEFAKFTKRILDKRLADFEAERVSAHTQPSVACLPQHTGCIRLFVMTPLLCLRQVGARGVAA